ncbi:MAG: hypothetical protein NTV43_06000 [Methylococcales bacterium]|nr:hypothetical protein [Methylococcales bacterium]
MLYAIAKQTRHSGQIKLKVSHTHSEAGKEEEYYRRISTIFRELWATVAILIMAFTEFKSTVILAVANIQSQGERSGDFEVSK